MKSTMTILALAVALFCSTAIADRPSATKVSNWTLQAVDGEGMPAYDPPDPPVRVEVEGIILNRPEYMLDTNTAWQMYIQGDQGDDGGTAVYMRKVNYMPGQTYSDSEWLNELDRISYDEISGYRFMPGDKVRVNGRTLFYGGKRNINEQHSIDPDNDFFIDLVKRGAGLPDPNVIMLNEVKDDNNEFIFDAGRATGCERYQSRLVRINNVSFVDPELWGPDATLEITDGNKTFPVKLGIGPGITVGSNNLPTWFDVIGIFDQEGSTTGGYRLWVTNYDGNGRILADGCDMHGIFSPADFNRDCKVDLVDLSIFAAEWLSITNPLLLE